MFHLDSYWYNPQALPLILTSTVIFLTGLFVYLQNREALPNITFFLLCLGINCWHYGNALMYSSRHADTALTWYRTVSFLGVTHIAPLVFTFSTLWLHRAREFQWAIIAGFILMPVFYLTGLLTPWGIPEVRSFYWGFYPHYGIPSAFFLLIFFCYFLGAFYVFYTELKRENDPIKRKQIKLIAIAFFIAMTGSVDYIPKFWNIALYPVGYLPVLIWILIVAYVIIRYKAMDIQTVIHKTLMWLASMTVAMLPFVAGIYFFYRQLLSLSPAVLSLVFVSLTVIFSFYLRAIQPYLDKVFQRRSTNLNRVLTRFSAELVHLKNLRDMLQGTVRTIRRNLYTREISILLQDDSREFLTPVIAKRVRGLKPVALSHPFLKWLESKDQVVISDLLPSNPGVQWFKEELTDYLQSSASKVIIPLVQGGKLIGIIHLGNKEGLRRYTSEDIIFLSRLKSPLTIAVSNTLHMMAMQENLRKWNEELEKKVDERTKQLQDTQAQLVQAEKLATIGTLAGGVAHEINNPLTAVLTNAQMLKMTANAEDIESLDLIEQGAKRCQNIIHKLMKYARKPMGPEIMGKVDLNKVADNTVAFLKYQMEQENVQLVLKKQEGVPLVEGNANEIEQVLTNLILNAKDAVKAAGRPGKISVLTCFDKEKIELKVADNGIGISEENRKKIFDPFFTTKELGKGTGLGLAVSFGIVERHGGMIEVHSVPGESAEFNIVFKK